MTSEIVRLVYLALSLGADPVDIVKTCRGHHACEAVLCDYVQGNDVAASSTLLSYCHRSNQYEDMDNAARYVRERGGYYNR